MPAAGQTRARGARVALVPLAAVLTLLGAAGAHADQVAELREESARVAAAGETLAAESRSVVLELYAVESELDRVRSRLARLGAEIDSLESRQHAERRRLALVRASLRRAEDGLADRLRELYMLGDPDPLAVLLGAASLDEALVALESLDRFAVQDRAIVRRVKSARADLRAVLRDLAERKTALEALAAEVAAAEASLIEKRSERRAYLTRLREQRRLNAAQLGRLAARAEAARERAARIEAAATAPQPAAEPASPPPTAPTAPPAPPAAPAAGGRQMTVVATGYALPGATATGMPTGWGVVAVDPSVIPLGTRMTIPGYGEGVAADTGSAVRGAMIDLWFPTRAQALAWGRRTVTITLH